jgi:hypothetical protein
VVVAATVDDAGMVAQVRHAADGFRCARAARPGRAKRGKVHVAAAINIEEFLEALGFDTPAALRRARSELQARKLTNPRKQAFAAEKQERIEAALSESLARACSDACAAVLARGKRRREDVRVTRAGCEVCSGSNNRAAAAQCIAALKRGGIAKVVIVGGTPSQQRDLRALLAHDGLALRFVDGTGQHAAKEAEHNKRWGQLIVIWGPTPLRHAVSDRYTEERYEGLKVVTVPRRGIEALCGEIVRAVR